jgi:hypothetical protein
MEKGTETQVHTSDESSRLWTTLYHILGYWNPVTDCRDYKVQDSQHRNRIEPRWMQRSVTHKLSSKANLAGSCIVAQERRNCNAQQMGAMLHISQAGSLNSIRLLCTHPYQSGAYVPHYLIPANTVKTWKKFVLVVVKLVSFLSTICDRTFFAELRRIAKEIARNSSQHTANFK